MNASEPRDELSLLLAGQVLGDLDSREQLELRSIVDAVDAEPNLIQERNELALAAATLDLMLDTNPDSSMPEALRQRILDQSERFLAKPAALQAGSLYTEDVRPTDDRTAEWKQGGSWSTRERFAWLACAASLLLAVAMVGWKSNGTVPNASLESQRLALLSDMPDVLRVDWAAGTTPLQEEVSGDVVWSNEEQKGFMRFVGLPVNDPTIEQYQLWIIDPDRDDEPVDGGVFDIRDGQETIVAIDAKLKVIDPAAFAITIEKPGGVVVSTQERLPLLASVR